MSKLNPLGLSYGDSDDDSDSGAIEPLTKKVHQEKTSTKSYAMHKPPANIHTPPIPHCQWSACYDENSGFTYYWNQHTNAVTWEAPPEYLLALKLAQQQISTGKTAEVTAAEWKLYQQSLVEKQQPQNNANVKPPPVKKQVKKNNNMCMVTCKEKKIVRKRPSSDSDTDYKIELITSYHNSDSESNDDIPAIPQATSTSAPNVRQPLKRQKTKPNTEFAPTKQTYSQPIGPTLPSKVSGPAPPIIPHVPKLVYSMSIGPELPPKQTYSSAIGPELPPSEPKSPIIPPVQENITKSPESCASTEQGKSTPKPVDENSDDENSLLEKLKDKAKLLEKLGGELPSEIQRIIKEDSEKCSPKSDTRDLDVDELLAEIEKKELPKVAKAKKIDLEVKIDSASNSPRSMTPPIDDKILNKINGATLFPSAVNISETVMIRPKTPPVEKEKKPNMYLLDTKDVVESHRKKLRISNSVLPKKIEKVATPSYTTKYSQFIEGFSSERTGLGFSGDDNSNSVPKNSISYGNGLVFTKGETLNEDKKDEDLDNLVDLVEAKLKYLNELQPSELTPVQEMLIQMQTLLNAFRVGALTGDYLRRWSGAAQQSLSTHEAAAAPPGWLCVFQRYAPYHRAPLRAFPSRTHRYHTNTQTHPRSILISS
ncbi:unnamed protein product [Leptidea sinapis]|uniref:WW domain-containing protein n=1 Tax=Leptidea sinapis TaxID=189913 RepID=A0A5E4QHA1_9NEOP|nr:unnamed protein product [Leptidea sinapis]